MPRKARKDLETGFFHVMVQGIKKEKIFYNNKYKEKYIYLMKFFKEKQKIDIISFCVMENHVHIIIYTEDINELTIFMRKLNTTYAINYNKEEKRVGYVFRNRFECKEIYNQDYLTKCIKYVHMNPVKAGIVRLEKEYKYSSYNDYINKKGIITKEIIQKIFNSKYNYLKEFLKIEYDEKLFKELEKEEITEEKVQEEIDKFIKKEEITLKELQEDKRLIKKLYNSMELKPTKTKLAENIGISRIKLSKILNDYREIKKKD